MTTGAIAPRARAAPLWARAAAAVAALPMGLRVVLVVTAVLHGVGLSWGMPSSDSWAVDGVAPRDFLPGLAATFTPGDYYTYPPLHLAILALLTLPVTLLAVARAGSTSVPLVLQEILSPGYMTAMTMTARVVTLAMSLGIVLALAKIAEEIAPRERKEGAAVGAAAFASVGYAFTYYSHTSNLDVPYLCWGSLAALVLVRAIARREPRRLRRFAVLAALAVATKDQAYALFLVGAPLTLATWALLDRWAREAAGRIAREAAIGAAIGVAILLFVDGAVTNPSGFRARVAFLTGSASQDYATYSRDLAGRAAAFVDTFRAFRHHYPWPLAPLPVGGLVVALAAARREGRARLAAALVPLSVALSFTLVFNLVARRVEERFTLPQALFIAVYAGFALERMWHGARAQGLRLGLRAMAIGALALGAVECVRIDATLLADPRYQAEAFLATATQPGDTIEVHGLNVYLLRFPPGRRVTRVGPTDPAKRGPIPGVEEVQAPLSAVAERRPRFIVVSGCYVWRYLERDVSYGGGRIVPPTQGRDMANADATAFFQGLFRGGHGYHLVHDAQLRAFRRAEMHASLACPVFTFERDEP